MLRKFSNMGTTGNRGFIFQRNGSVFQRDLRHDFRQGDIRQNSPNTYWQSPFGRNFHANIKQRRVERPKPKAFEQRNGWSWEHNTGSWSHSFQRPFQTFSFEGPFKNGHRSSGFAEKGFSWGDWGMLGLGVGLWGLTQAQAEEKEGLVEKEEAAEAVDAEKHVRLDENNFEATFKVILARLKSNDPKLLSIIISVRLNEGALRELYEAIKDNTTIGYIEWHKNQMPSGPIGFINDKLIENNKNYRYYPNDYMHVLLSAHVYENSKEETFVSLTGIDDRVDAQYLKDWKVYRIFNDTQTTGYYGVIYVNDKTHQIVLASRGSENPVEELLKKQGDWKTNFEQIMGGRIIAGQQAWNYLATEEAVNLAKEKGYNLSLTGHSLGGWLAELGAYYCHAYFRHPNVKAVTFDSPGSQKMMEKLNSKHKDPDMEVNLKHIEIVTYLAAPNPINSCNHHVGKVYRVNREMKLTQWMDSKIPGVIMKQIGGGNLHGALSLEGHTLGGILLTFDPQIGKPKENNYTRIADWPRLEYHGEEKNFKETAITFIDTSSLKTRVTIEAIDHLVSDTTLMSFIGLFINIAEGEIDQTEYWEYFKHIDSESTDGKSIVKQNLKFDEKFSLVAKAHYREANRIVLKLNEGSVDKLLYDLYFSKEKLDTFEGLPEIVKVQLKDLAKSFEVKALDDDEQGKRYELIPKKLDANEIRQRMRRLKAVIPNSIEKLKILSHGIDVSSLSNNKDKRKKSIKRIQDGLPLRDQKFIPRQEELKKIEKELEEKDIAIICGLQGVGKASLAEDYAQDLKKKGNQVKWIEASSQVIDSEWVKFGDTLEIKTGKLTIDQIRDAIYNHLGARKECIYLIMNNIEKEEDLLRFLDNNRPPNIKVLITTSNEKLLEQRGYKPIKLLGFNKTKALEYCNKRELNDAIAKDLVKGLMRDENNEVRPLDLDLAVSHFLKYPGTKVEEYLSQHQGYWDIGNSIRALDENAKKVLKYCAYLGPDEIPVSLLENLVGSKLYDGISTLREASLVNFERKEGKLRLHREVQDTVRNKTEDVSLVKELLDKIIPVFLHFRVQDEATLKTAKQQIKIATSLAEAVKAASIVDHSAMQLFTNLGICYMGYVTKDLQKSRDYYQQALKIAKDLYLENDPFLAKVLSDVGNACYMLANYKEAKDFYEQAIEILEKNLHLGILKENRHHEIAEPNKDIKILIDTTVLNNIATLFDLLGSTYEGLGHHEKGLNLRKNASRIFKVLHLNQNYNPFWHNIGNSYQKLGNYKKALKYQELALSGSVEAKDYHRLYGAFYAVGKTYQELGDSNKALEYFKQIYSILVKILGDNENSYVEHLKKAIEDLQPDFFRTELASGVDTKLLFREGCNEVGNECRTTIPKRGDFNEATFDIKDKLQMGILNTIQELGEKGLWSTKSSWDRLDLFLDWGIRGYIENSYLQRELGPLNNQKNLETAKMLCFEAINLGIMKSPAKPYQVVQEFTKANAGLVKKIAEEHPEYFVDGSIVEACIRTMPDDLSFKEHLLRHTGIAEFKARRSQDN